MDHALFPRGRSRHGPRGAPLSGAPRGLDADRLRRLLAERTGDREVAILTETASTNDEARALAARGAAEGAVVVADRQTAGRGRLGRSWHSPSGCGVYLSVLLRPRRPSVEVPRWALAAALAACEACREATGLDVRIKWPNDLRIGVRKVAGVLAEARSASGETTDLVLGVGLNANHEPDDFPGELRAKATSLRIAGGRPVDREAITVGVVARLLEHHEALSRGVWNHVAEAWTRLAEGVDGSRVRVQGAGSEFEGVAAGVDGYGALRVLRADGSVVAVRDAETVRPLEE